MSFDVDFEDGNHRMEAAQTAGVKSLPARLAINHNLVRWLSSWGVCIRDAA